MESYKRTVTCGELDTSSVGTSVTLNGWVHRLRDHGGVTFINLRDRYGITQVLVDPNEQPDAAARAGELKMEYCIAVEGEVRRRPDDMINPDMSTGEIEVAAVAIHILSTSETLPFMIDERTEARDELRQKYRYLDMRSFSMQRKLQLRHNVSFAVREFLHGRSFLEIETPTMIRSTPEGARDFLVPSRLQPGRFYALPQSPQLYKQILMVGGFDRYFQLAHCFRDEDLRGDRQPEHTQIDLEMSFVSKEDIFEVVEGMLANVFAKALNVELALPFPRLDYQEAMDTYGSDKPDLRYDLPLRDFAAVAAGSDFGVFNKVLDSGGAVRVLRAPGCAGYSRKQIDELEATAKVYGAKGLAWMKVNDAGALEGGISRFFQERAAEVVQAAEAEPGDLLLFVADGWKTAVTSLGAVRRAVGNRLDPAANQPFRFAWIVDFPLFEWNDEEERWEAAHHMFTMPQEQYIDDLESNTGAVKGDLYDLVCNGIELGSGSIRIQDPDLQRRIFGIVGFSEEEAQRRFGFLLESFRYGPPPHGGIALGLDRLVMLLAGEESIREVMTFPKNSVGATPMDGAPSGVDPAQLEELGLRLMEADTAESDAPKT
ncbi:MAG: aspartate--tRNA ligase [Spirochaetaceae bacterium]